MRKISSKRHFHFSEDLEYWHRFVDRNDQPNYHAHRTWMTLTQKTIIWRTCFVSSFGTRQAVIINKNTKICIFSKVHVQEQVWNMEHPLAGLDQYTRVTLNDISWAEMAKWPWRSRSMTSILNTSWENTNMHSWCKFGDSSSNPLKVITKTSQNRKTPVDACNWFGFFFEHV